jgi:hypothetical protein
MKTVHGALRGVPGRPRHDPAGLLLVGQRVDQCQHPARFERAGLLQQLGLEVHVLTERAAGERRRAVQTAPDDVARALDLGPVDHGAIVRGTSRGEGL